MSESKKIPESVLAIIARMDAKRAGQAGAVIWPDRYCVYAKAEKFPRGGAIYKDVLFILFRDDMQEEEAIQLLEPYGFSPEDEDWLYSVSQAEETFTEEQARELIAYLEIYPDTQAYMEPATEPRAGMAGVGAQAVGGPTGFYMFWHTEDYKLPYKVAGYYSVEGAELISSGE